MSKEAHFLDKTGVGYLWQKIKNYVTTTVENAAPNITIDTTPTKDSTNPVQSGGVKSALDAKADIGSYTQINADFTYSTSNMSDISVIGVSSNVIVGGDTIFDAAEHYPYNVPTLDFLNEILITFGIEFSEEIEKMKSQIASAYTLSLSNKILIFTTPNGPNSRIYIGGDTLELVSWTDGTDEQIAAMIALADAGEIDLVKDAGWKVGDTRKVSLAAMEKTGTFDGVSWTVGESHAAQNVELVLMNVGGVKLADGNDCHFVVGMKDCLNEGGYMNATNTNAGSWDGCARRNWCNGAFRQALPETLRGIFKQSSTITAKEYNGTELKTSADYFFLPSEKEIFGAKTYSNAAEFDSTDLAQWTWYATPGNRIKKSSGSASYWWERSTASGRSIFFCRVSSSGDAYYDDADGTRGIAPCGCI